MAAILEPSRLTPIPVPAAGHGAHRQRPGHPSAAPVSAPSLTAAVGLTSRAAISAALAVLVVLVVIAAASVSQGRRAVASPTSPGVPAAATAGPVVAVVEPGDTLWSIARELQPRGDIRPLVDRLVAANGSAVIVPGQELRLPPS